MGYILSYHFCYLGPYNTQLDKRPINKIDEIAFEHDLLYQFNANLIQEIDQVYYKKFIKTNSLIGYGVGTMLYIKYILEKIKKIYP